MKGIKVIDGGCDPEETQFGTCELCFSWGMADNPYMVLEFPDGSTAKCDTYYCDWGVYDEVWVDNVVDFSAWLSEQELTEEEVDDLKAGFSGTLLTLIDDYNNQIW